MVQQVETRQFDDYIVDIYPLTPSNGILMLGKLTKLFGEPLGIMGDALKNAREQTAKLSGDVSEAETAEKPNNSDQSGQATLLAFMAGKLTLPPDLLQNIVKSMINRLDEAEVLECIKSLVARCQLQAPGDASPRRINFDVDFAGQLPLLLKVTKSAIEVNYGNFFVESLASVGLRRRT